MFKNFIKHNKRKKIFTKNEKFKGFFIKKDKKVK